MDYEEHLSAAKFRAERDMARQEVKELREELDAIKVEREYDVKALNHRIAEMEPRLMPGGCEWPRYESGEPVPIGGEFMGKDGKTYIAKQIRFNGKCFSMYDFCDRKPQFNGFYGERVKRPVVLAADNKPLEVGQTVWFVEDGDSCDVAEISSDGRVRIEYFDGSGSWHDASEFVHQRPVLDADGVPIKEGDTVYWLEHTVAFTVVSPHEMRDNAGYELKCGHTVEIAREGHEPHMYVHPESLHHTKPDPPDSWEKWREEFIKPPCVYCRDILGVEFDDDTELDRAFDAQVQDMERRAMKLAEKENGNE